MSRNQKHKNRNTFTYRSRGENIGRTVATIGVTALALGGGFMLRGDAQANAASRGAEKAEQSGDLGAAVQGYTEAVAHEDSADDGFGVAVAGSLTAAMGTGIVMASKKHY